MSPTSRPERANWINDLNLLPVARLCMSADPAYAADCARRTIALAERRADRELAAQARALELLADHGRGATTTEDAIAAIRELVNDPCLPEADRVGLLVELSRWEAQSGRSGRAIALAADARRRALDSGDHAGAASACLELGVIASDHAIDRSSIIALLDEAVDHFAFAGTTSSGNEGIARSLLTKANVMFGSGAVLDALGVYAEARTHVPANHTTLMLTVLARTCIAQARVGHPNRANITLTHARAVLALHDAPIEVRALLSLARGTAAAASGDVSEAEIELAETVRYADQGGLGSLANEARAELVALRSRSGDHEGADRIRREYVHCQRGLARGGGNQAWFDYVTAGEFRRKSTTTGS